MDTLLNILHIHDQVDMETHQNASCCHCDSNLYHFYGVYHCVSHTVLLKLALSCHGNLSESYQGIKDLSKLLIKCEIISQDPRQ